MTWKTAAQQEKHTARDGKPKFWEQKARFDLVQAEIAAIEARASHVAMGMEIEPRDKERYSALKRERRELKKAMGIQ